MMASHSRKVGLVAFVATWMAIGGCSEVPDPLAIDARGSVAVQVYIDRNGNGVPDASIDVPAPGIAVELTTAAGAPVATANVAPDGTWAFEDLPVGGYRLRVPASALGDSLQLVVPDDRVEVPANDVAVRYIGLTYRTVEATDLALLPTGRIVALDGMALNGAGTFSDRLVHVLDGDVAARAVVAATGVGGVGAGDSVRVIGRVGEFRGRPALLEATAFSTASGPAPAAAALTIAEAAFANGGAADGMLATITAARVLDVASIVGGGIRLRISDGSSTLDVVVDPSVQIATEDPIVPGVDVTVTGVLVPGSSGSEWTIRPRSSDDVTVAIPAVDIAGARDLPVGTVVSLTGVALNGPAGFSDRSLHIADASGAIRTLPQGTPFVFPGDSVRVSGVIAIGGGQVVVAGVTATVLAKASLRPPTEVNTSVAAEANGGALDAALVFVRSATVEAVGTAGSSTVVAVDDDTGRLEVLIDGSTGIAANLLKVGDTATITGVLVPVGDGTWRLKPRSPGDVVREEE